MKKIKYIYICENCYFIKQKESNYKTKILYSLKFLFGVFFGVMFLIGFTSFLNFVWVNNYENPDNLISIGGTFAFVTNSFGEYRYDSEIRELQPLSEEIVKDCTNDTCKVKKLYENLTTFRYKTENVHCYLSGW